MRADDTVPVRCFITSHDITSLSAWGPYTKRYVGVSHIQDMASARRFDFSVMPGFYRNRQMVPHVLFESGYYPWFSSGDLRSFTYRYELEWKDRVLVDVTYNILDDASTEVSIECVNNTGIFQNLSLNLIAYMDEENHVDVCADDSLMSHWTSAMEYLNCDMGDASSPSYHLLYDGRLRGEQKDMGSLDGYVLSGGFGANKGDVVTYRINVDENDSEMVLRHKTPKGKRATFVMSGAIEDTIVLEGTGEYSFYRIPLRCTKGSHLLEMTSVGTSSTSIDGFFILPAGHPVGLISNAATTIPKISCVEKDRDMILKYDGCPVYYGIVWDFENSQIREILDDKLEFFLRRKTHDHVSTRLIGNRNGHYSNAFLRPVVIGPGEKKTITALIITSGDENVVRSEISAFHHNLSRKQHVESKQNDRMYNGNFTDYLHSQRLLQATLLQNIVYPVRTQGQFIRHFTPGKNWNSLYTWDSGVIASALAEVNPTLSFECIRAYTTDEKSQSEFIHHGTPLPTQIFAYFDLWQITHDRRMANFLYPRLKKIFMFLSGLTAGSTTVMPSGLLRTWDYFYNSGGWDDYPPQKALAASDKKYVTPVVSTAYCIRAARVLKMMAIMLGKKSDMVVYDGFISRATDAIEKYSWDDEAGYYSYVVHDADGWPSGHYLFKDSVNYNMGLDGLSPMVAGTATLSRVDRMVGNMFDPQKIWSDVGLSTVDQSSPYYRQDGYWNGTVWFPHQWFLWRALLDYGLADEAWKVASTALDVWRRECDESYYTFEHFIISSGRGAGWHQFSGLSSPLINWFNSYFLRGHLTTGYDIMTESTLFENDHTSCDAVLLCDDVYPGHERTVICVMNPEFEYSAMLDKVRLKTKVRMPGVLEITVPQFKNRAVLKIRKK